MFSQPSVCPQRGACVAKVGGMCGKAGGGGHVWRGGMCGKGGVYGEGGGMHGQGACMAGGCMAGVCMAEETSTAANRRHPTGMHSCLEYIY